MKTKQQESFWVIVQRNKKTAKIVATYSFTTSKKDAIKQMRYYRAIEKAFSNNFLGPDRYEVRKAVLV